MTPTAIAAEQGASWLVLCDFDETFWTHDPSRRDPADLERLVELLASPSSAPIRFGFVTGSSPQTVRDRVASWAPAVPMHFLGANLGTELVVDADGEPVDEPRWSARMPATHEHAARVTRLVDHARAEGVDLVAQPTNGQARYQANYYLAASTPDLDDDRRVALLRAAAQRAGLGLNVNHCNPSAGDPEGFLDVDIVPRHTGKAHIAQHLQLLWGVPSQRTFAFGDSGNDIDMLRCAEHSWLVANATGEARRQHPRVTRRAHLGGIVDTLRDTLSRETS